MAKVLIQEDKRRLLATAFNIGERQELLRLPSRKWLQQAQMVSIPLNRLASSAMLESYRAGRLGLGPEVVQRLTEVSSLKIRERDFPKWYAHHGPTPFAKQREGSQKIYKVDNGAFFCEMGTGKTKMTIDVLSAHFMELRFDAVLVICPNTVKSVWPMQVTEHSPVPAVFHDADANFDYTEVRPMRDKIHWVISNVEAYSQGHAYGKILPLLDHCRCAIVIDESHDIKNHKSIRSERIIKMRDKAVLRYILTGTPLLKNMIDLYAQFEFLDPNIIGAGDYYAFRNRYCIMGGFKGKQIVGYNHTDELLGLIEPYTFQCLKKEVVDLPEKLRSERFIKLTDEQRKLYDSVKKGLVAEVSVAHILTRILRLRQIAGGFLKEDDKPMMLNGQPVLNSRGKKIMVEGKSIPVVPEESNPKIVELCKICEEIEGSIVIWAVHVVEIHAIVRALKPYGEAAIIIGDTTDEERELAIKEFQNGRKRFFVGTQMAGGVGTTLTRAQTMVYFTNSYSLKDRLQSEDRAHRIGQKNPVLYIDLTASKTVDLIIQRAVMEKKDLADYVAEQLGQKMTVSQLLEDL